MVKKEEKIKMSVSEVIEKATVANVSAFIVVVAGTAACIVYQKWELLAMLVGGAIGFLWPKVKE